MVETIALIRLDKIGDLINTLPMDQLPEFQGKRIKWVVAKGLGAIVQWADPPRDCLELSLTDWRTSYKKLVSFLQEERATTAVVFYAPWWVSLALWKAGVRNRIGRKSQWHSFLFFNNALRQTRSLAEKHEADYNRELVEFGFPLPEKKSSAGVQFHILQSRPSATTEPAAVATPLLKLTPPENPKLLEKLKVREKQYYVVHPGMAGSALNWPPERYSELLEKLTQDSIVVITGTAADEFYLKELRTLWQNHPQVRWTQGELSLQELLSLLKSAKAVIAPSTGVLHLAASLDTHAIGIYSPVQVHHPRRWGPRGPNTRVRLPPVKCPATGHCLKEKCSFHPCMKRITVEDVLSALP